MRFRFESRVGCDDVGRRVSVRFMLAAGGYSDVVGVLETCDDATFGIRDRSGTLRRVSRSEVVASKVVPPPRG